ncbi:MAG: hypothetical protein KGJ13_02870 [Patescibacteria group bacterium]|nr:hypothetical protein [Patescibacteria group bacterium]
MALYSKCDDKSGQNFALKEYALPLERLTLPLVGEEFDDEYPPVGDPQAIAAVQFAVMEASSHLRHGYGEILLVLKETDLDGEAFQHYLDEFWFASPDSNQVKDWARGADIPMPVK